MDILASNNDIIFEILSRLPAESLLKFETISKGWHKTITDNSFRRVHCQRERVAISGFFLQKRSNGSNHVSYLSFNTTDAIVRPKFGGFLADKVRLSASSNGLICCRTAWPDGVFYVCNPATKEHVQIERPKEWRPFDNIAIASDPLCNPVDDCLDFMLVGVCQDHYPSSFTFHIYSSKTKEWRELDTYRPEERFLIDMLHGPSVFASGVLYWMCRFTGVIALDLETNEPNLVSFDCRNDRIHGACIGESAGRLHYILMYKEDLEVWFLESKTKWALKHSISLFAMEEKYPQFLFKEAKRAARFVPRHLKIGPCIEPLAFKDGILLLKLHCGFSKHTFRYEYQMVDGCTKLYLYNIGSTKSLKELCTIEQSKYWVGSFNAIPYGITMAPLESSEVAL